MYYNPEYNESRGWICPKCGRVYSPDTPICFYCNNTESTTITATSANYTTEWTKYLNHISTDSSDFWDNIKKQWLNKE